MRFYILWTDEVHFTAAGNNNAKNIVHWANTDLYAVSPYFLMTTKILWVAALQAQFFSTPNSFRKQHVTCSTTGSHYRIMFKITSYKK